MQEDKFSSLLESEGIENLTKRSGLQSGREHSDVVPTLRNMGEKMGRAAPGKGGHAKEEAGSGIGGGNSGEKKRV